ncbi:MAG: hypothetical protein IKB51_03940 [Clostridia bacterium]|nr:hypothetical protein [Clostridia bacterium]
MKKRTILAVMLIALVLGAGAGLGVYMVLVSGMGGAEVAEYVKTEVIPTAFDTVVILMTVYIGVNPSLKTILNAAAQFVSAKKNVDSVSESSAQTAGKVDELITELKATNAALLADNEAAKAQVEAMRNEFGTIKRAMRIAFCNNSELVRNGYAKLICEVMDDDKAEN